MRTLTINTGSTSVRLGLYQVLIESDAPPRALHALRSEASDGASVAVLESFLAGQDWPDAVVHRVVHGGDTLVRPTRVDDVDGTARAEIQRWASLAPLHNTRALHWMGAADTVLPGVPQVAVFDTAFYADLPAVARAYALPAGLVERYGLRRYGFHGLAHQAMVTAVLSGHPQVSTARIISLQLGGGCSLTASRGGRPVDTTMGFSPLEGLMMATRSGDVDPGLITWLCQHAGLSPSDVETLLNQQSGLLGVAGSAHLRDLLNRDDPAAQLAIDLYVHRIRKALGAAVITLGGVDAIVFGGGVGEHAPTIRARILADLDWLGIVLDPFANAAAQGGDARISATDSAVILQVVSVDEGAVQAAAASMIL